jgi:DNA-binding response OmpR family regulator
MTADNAPASRLLGLPISAVLRKPFDIDELLQLVEQMRMPAAA